MSIPPPQAPTLGDRPGGTKTMRRPLVNLPTCAKAGLSCALLACPFFYSLDIDQSKMTFHMNCS